MAEGDVFLALKGPNHNGHDFINKALDKGASCLITEKEIPGETYIKTENTFLFLEELAKFQRLNFKQDVIAITGSNGKTSTKEILYQLTKNFFENKEVFKSPGNWNNKLGLYLSLLELKKNHKLAIFEIGTNAVGEIKELASFLKPNIGVLTNIGNSHQDGLKKYVRTNKGEIIETNINPPSHGQDVRVTLDAKLQYLVYRELEKAFNYFDASSASAILVDLNSKDILAMANYPSFDPNDRRGMNPALLANRSATDLFEPGSTVKPLALAGLLKEEIIYKDEIIKTSPGYIEYEGFLTSDFKDYGTLSLSEVISKSSNVAMVKLCDKSNPEKIVKNFYQWGFGKYINEIFISNREGYLPSSANLSEREKVSLCYGYGLQVTLIQLVGAYTALFSNGQFQGLNLISGSYNGFEDIVISEEIAMEIKDMLSEAVNTGTGRNALVKNTKIIGKTGTTKISTNQGYTEKSFNASFVGMAELKDKNFVLGILVRDAKENGEGGGQVAAPVFSEIIKSIKNTL